MKKIYFKGLTEIIAIAALFVIFHHLELYKSRDGFFSLYDTPFRYFISHLGKNGVYIFFVLSGFLITYLLLSEKQLISKINIKKFYFRRILRIWPLYYLIVLISFTIVPFLANNFVAFQNETHYFDRILLLQESPYITLLLFLLFLPNLAIAIKPAVVGAAQSWSVGVEEQFYIIWPHIINQVTNKYILLLVFSIICVFPEIAKIIWLISPTFGQYLINIVNLLPIHFMAVGGIGAFFLFHYKITTQKIFKNKFLFILNTFLLILFLMVGFKIPLKDKIFGFIVIIEIIFIIQPCFKVNLRNKFLEKIGDISYGMYMYHPLMMYICFSFWNTIYPIENIIVYNISVYSSVIISTLIISKVSFKYFENKFISLKNRKFTVINSGKTKN